MTRIIASIICALLLSACPAMALDETSGNAQFAATIKSCLAIAEAKEETAFAAETEKPEPRTDTSPQALFAASAAARALAAGYERESCIGILAGPCAEAEGYSLMGEHGCIGEELSVWDELLNAAYRENLGLPALPLSEETAEEEASKNRAAEPVPDCQPVACEISANDNLRKTQRAFSAWREAMCQQNYIESQGGRENQIEIVRCQMNLTARQFIWLKSGRGFE